METSLDTRAASPDANPPASVPGQRTVSAVCQRVCVFADEHDGYSDPSSRTSPSNAPPAVHGRRRAEKTSCCFQNMPPCPAWKRSSSPPSTPSKGRFKVT